MSPAPKKNSAPRGPSTERVRPDRKADSTKEECFSVVGIVMESLPNAMFHVKLENDKVILAYCSGRMKMNRIRILDGDKVEIEMTPYDMTKGRITYRHK